MNPVTFNTRFGRLTAVEWGNPQGDVVIASHGWLDNAATFDVMAPCLSDKRIICLDLPGHGLSPWLPPEADYHIWTPVEAVVEVVRGFDSPVHLMGHSMGGVVSLLAAAAVPERVRSVVSIDVIGPLTQSPSNVLHNFRAAITPLPSKVARIYASKEDAIQVRADASKLSPSVVRGIACRNLSTVDGGCSWRTDPRLRNLSRFRFTPDIAQVFLAGIACPALIIRALDGYLSKEKVDMYLPFIAGGRCVTVPGHHHCHLDEQYAPAVVSAILEFYSE